MMYKDKMSDLFKNTLGVSKTHTLEVETLNNILSRLHGKDIMAKTNKYQTHPGNVMLNNLVIKKKRVWKATSLQKAIG